MCINKLKISNISFLVPEFLEILKPMKTEKEMTNLIFDVIKEDPAKFKEDFLKLRGKLSSQGRKRVREMDWIVTKMQS